MERIPCENQEACPLANTQRGCFEDIDHKYWPRRFYRTVIEKAFRELEENKRLICRQQHQDHHATAAPPPKPPRNFMIETLNRGNENGNTSIIANTEQ